MPRSDITYEERHAALVRYLEVKVQEHDWRMVAHVANDLRVLEASSLREEVRMLKPAIDIRISPNPGDLDYPETPTT